MTLFEIMAALRDGMAIGKNATADYPFPNWIFFEIENTPGWNQRLAIHGWGSGFKRVRAEMLEDLLLRPEEWVLGSRTTDEHGHLGDFQPEE